MDKFTEPLSIHSDLDAIIAEMDAADRRRDLRRAGGRRIAPRRSPLATHLGAGGTIRPRLLSVDAADLADA
jgi:hypothetical protein